MCKYLLYVVRYVRILFCRDGFWWEVQMTKLIDHPNLLQAHYSFTTGCHLWLVIPYMAVGSCLHIMKTSLFKRTLKGLFFYFIASYILINSNGAVKLVDFGVSACTFHTGDRHGSRNTFAGTPCWMAPEVMQQFHGYDFKANIWSFRIIALELAHGHAPFSKYPPMKVLLMTLQITPPGLDYERDKILKGLIGSCLLGVGHKKHPTLEKLIKHHFFKHARLTDYYAEILLSLYDIVLRSASLYESTIRIRSLYYRDIFLFLSRLLHYYSSIEIFFLMFCTDESHQKYKIIILKCDLKLVYHILKIITTTKLQPFKSRKGVYVVGEIFNPCLSPSPTYTFSLILSITTHTM
ncbi:hypothetical protein UlMin_020010 [Ulmus minor]